MGFIQIIEFTTSRRQEMDALFAQWDGASQGPNPVTRLTMTADRDRPDTYLAIVEFDSYEEAMLNSERPETGEYSAQMMALCDGPPVFRNLDVTERR
jgi:hypothetical protein